MRVCERAAELTSNRRGVEASDDARLEGVAEDDLETVIASKFEFVVTCQIYGKLKAGKPGSDDAWKAASIDKLRSKYAHNLRVAYVDTQPATRAYLQVTQWEKVGTKPPPKTRSNSPEPVENRATSGASIADSGNASTTLGRPAACVDKRTLAGTSSTSTRSRASHVPQSGHFPAQVGCVDPHSVQRKVCFGALGPDFGITNPFSSEPVDQTQAQPTTSCRTRFRIPIHLTDLTSGDSQ